MKRFTYIVLALLPVAAGATAAESDWFPADAEEGMASQLAERLGELSTAKRADAAALLERARKDVRRQRERLESWGRNGTLERAPDLSKLEMPKSGDTVLDAIARYQMCNAILYMVTLDREGQKDETARLTAARGLVGITLAVVYLASPMLVADGTDERLKAFLTSDAQEAVLNRVQDRPELREHAARQCGPVVSALIAD